MSKIRVMMRVPVTVTKEPGAYVAECPLLDVTSQGDTEQESMDNLLEALQLFLETCYNMGTLEQVLKQSGFGLVREDNEEEEDNHYLDVPFSLLAAQNHATPIAC